MFSSKPVIFFSHSADDRDLLLPIRNRLLSGTGNAIDVFMSSDGASIPFGSNWLNETEKALESCELMFVWLTPRSLASRWILFESGYVYSKEIKVVPVGIDGIRLENVPPPLSNLQGFDVTSASGLNNIVAIINKKFDLTFSEELFDDTFYRESVQHATSEDSPELLRFVTLVVCEFFHSMDVGRSNPVYLSHSWLSELKAEFEQRQVVYSLTTGKRLEIHGIGFRVEAKPHEGRSWAEFHIDPMALNETWPHLIPLLDRFYPEELPYLQLDVRENPAYSLPEDTSIIGSRLLNTEVTFDMEMPNVLFCFRNIKFRFILRDVSHRDRRLTILVPRSNIEPIPLLSLMRLLVERQILTKRIP